MPIDIPTSVFDRLKRHAKATGKDFNLLLDRYAAERFLYRLSRSPYANGFLLKGAMLFAVWEDEPHRPTRDIDLLGLGERTADAMLRVFSEVCQVSVEDDGAWFDPASVTVSQTRRALELGGMRLQVRGRLGTARLRVQTDIGFGDALAALPTTAVYPTLLDLPAPALRCYPAEAVIAEKVHALVEFGRDNSRMKDFYDLYELPLALSFAGESLVAAVLATFDGRGTRVPADLPFGLTPAFATEPMARRRWEVFLQRNHLSAIDLDVVIEGIRRFLEEPLVACATGGRFLKSWPAGGPWLSA